MNCEFCGEKFESQEALSGHLNRKHRDKVKLAILEHPERQKVKPKRPPTD